MKNLTLIPIFFFVLGLAKAQNLLSTADLQASKAYFMPYQVTGKTYPYKVLTVDTLNKQTKKLFSGSTGLTYNSATGQFGLALGALGGYNTFATQQLISTGGFIVWQTINNSDATHTGPLSSIDYAAFKAKMDSGRVNSLLVNVLHLTGNEIVTGNKNFTSIITGSIAGNSATATALQTQRAINGVGFDGTSNITITDATKLSVTGGTFTATNGSGVLGLLPQSSTPNTPTSGSVLFARSGGAFSVLGVNGNYYSFLAAGLTTNRTFTLPDANGTLPLLESNQTYTGTNTFSTDPTDGINKFLTCEVANTFATKSSSTKKRLILVLADETNGGIATLYLHDGTGLQWIPTSKLY